MLPRLLPLGALALLSCAAPPPRCPDPVAPPAKAPDTPAASKPAASSPRLAITLRPDPAASVVGVEIAAVADPAALGVFSMPLDGAFHFKGARDDTGPLALHLTQGTGPGARVSITFERPPVGELHVAYSVSGRQRALPALPVLDVDPNRFEASGESMLLLPEGLDDKVVDASIQIESDVYVVDNGSQTTTVGAASSFGAGARREVKVRGRELRGGVYATGPMGRASFDTAEGKDEAAWFGYTSFDPRPASADVAGFRTAIRELFRADDEPQLTLLLVADARPAGTFVASRRARSILVHVGAGETWSGPVRIAVAAEVIHGWIGSRLWIGPDGPEREAEAYWFTEGVTRHLARDLLFRFGLLTPAELLDEVHGLASVLATSPLRSRGNAALAARAKDPFAIPLLVARGALYAARVDALLRKKSGGKRGLEEPLRALFQKARERRGPLPTEAWVDAIAGELGAEERTAFARAIEQGGAIDLPDSALGPCFRGETRNYEAFDLGFDEAATRAAPDQVIAGLVPGGAAARAGLQPGDRLAEAVIRRGRSDVPVTITVWRGEQTKKVTYRPAGARAKGPGFARKKDVPDEACTR